MLSNLLQELALARDHGQKSIVLDEARLNENPVDRLSRMYASPRACGVPQLTNSAAQDPPLVLEQPDAPNRCRWTRSHLCRP